MSATLDLSPDTPPARRGRGRPSRAAGDASALIRRAALQEFARAGFDSVSIADIARLAGVAKPLIHYHYAAKELLWQAAVREGFENLQQELTAFRSTLLAGSGPETLRLIAHQLVRYAARYPELTRIVIDESGRGGERADWLLHTYLLPGYRLADLALQAFRSGHSNADSLPAAEHLIPVLLGLMHFPFLESRVLHAAFGSEVHSETYLQTQAELLYRVMRTLI